MDYVARRRSTDAGVGADKVIVTRHELETLHDLLYVLEAAIEDAEADLASARTLSDVRAAADHLLAAARPLTKARLLGDA